MNRIIVSERLDHRAAVADVLMALALYIPFRSRLPYHWDSAEGLRWPSRIMILFTVNRTRREYFLYVMAARLVNQVVGDPHTSLVWMSVIAGSLLAPVLYALGLTMFDRRTFAGLIAGAA